MVVVDLGGSPDGLSMIVRMDDKPIHRGNGSERRSAEYGIITRIHGFDSRPI